MSYTMKTNLANKKNYGTSRNTSSIKYIVIHYTSNDGDTDENNGNYFKNNIVKASAHYFVDDDSVTQSVPDNYVAWSVGGSKYADCNRTGGGKYYGTCTNSNSLSIEICDDVKNGTVYPSAATIENVIAFTKEKMKEYNIPQNNVIRHFDVTGKYCPKYWMDNAKWKEEFWNKLVEAPTQTTTNTTAAANVPFLIKVDKVSAGDVLNIRKEPNANATKTGQLAYNDPNTYTIVEVKDGWGRLKSGIGWISLHYTKTVSGSATAPKQESKPTPAPTPAPAPTKTLDDWAREVMNGKHGNGTANRTASLKNAGCQYSYQTVQNRVNELCGVKTSTAPAKKSIDEIAREVIAGKWGNGTDRKNRLKAAGYNYDQVQARVNQLYK